MLRLIWLCVAAQLLVETTFVRALGQPSCISFAKPHENNSFAISSPTSAALILLDASDWAGVHRAATNFAADINVQPVIIVGTLGKSALADAVVEHVGLDVSDMKGKWEAWKAVVVKDPLPGIPEAYLVLGADKRGTIYALYEHSEQFGVSPWYWWADVPIRKHDTLYVSTNGCSHGSPTVKYRGIFLNDEQPALQSWAMEKFTNGTGSAALNSPFNAKFYAHVFELLLRLKANYLWPAQWGSAFAVDDPTNLEVADMYGIVMGTSHQEPMMRSVPNEWNLFGNSTPWNYTSNSENIYNFWLESTRRSQPYESLYTLGMRGAGDLPLDESTNIELLEKVVVDQRKILAEVYGDRSVTDIPQLWTLYKEVQAYYEDGMRVPEDVTLLWADDNWGNIRRFPLPNERNRTGGAGIYYHIDFVGDPRDYKWITTTQLAKVHEQMSYALETQADRIWIVNVGDLKPYEREIEFFLAYGYNSSRWNTHSLDAFVALWAQRDFALSEDDSQVVATIVANLTRYNARRKPELLSSTTYSLTDYREAETILEEWTTLRSASQIIYDKLLDPFKPAYFQLVHHPVCAAATLGESWISAGINTLRASQARASANIFADRVEELFDQDWELEEDYHGLLDGKWNHMMDQTHIGYYYWQQPMTNSMPAVTRVQSKKQVLQPASPMRIAVEGSQGAWPGDNPHQCDTGYNCFGPTLTIDTFHPYGSKFIDIGSGGPITFTFIATTTVPWLKIEPSSGSITPGAPEQRLEVAVDWSTLPLGLSFGSILLGATDESGKNTSFAVTVLAEHTSVPSEFHGFVEGNGGISIEAAHASRNVSVGEVAWTELPGYGRTFSAVTPWPRTRNGGQNYTAGAGPSIEYDFYTFHTMDGQHISVTALVAPTLNSNALDRPIGVALQVDGNLPVTKYFIPSAPPGQLPKEWGGPDGFVANNIVSVSASFMAPPGAHTLKIWMIEPGVVVEKLVINTGGVRPSYLGPPESLRV